MAGIDTRFREFGVQSGFLPHGSRSELLEEQGLTAQQVARFATEQIVAVDSAAPLTSSER
jgi:1-deoxy-D-xylulose-5-phosphate synthase